MRKKLTQNALLPEITSYKQRNTCSQCFVQYMFNEKFTLKQDKLQTKTCIERK